MFGLKPLRPRRREPLGISSGLGCCAPGLAGLFSTTSTFDVRTKVVYSPDQVETALVRFREYLARHGWTWVPSGVPKRQIPCPAGTVLGAFCVEQTFRLQTSKTATPLEAQRAVRDAIFATGGLGRAIDVVAVAVQEGAEKTGELIDYAGETASKLWCASFKAATGVPCWLLIGGIVGAGLLYVAGPTLAAAVFSRRR